MARAMPDDRLPRETLTEVREAPVIVEKEVKGGYVWGTVRIGLGWIFLWSFLDKLIGLGFATGRDPETGAIDFGSGWIDGRSPTDGFLEFGTKGPFQGFFQDLAGSAWIEWVYMLSMAAIGLGLILGIGMRLAVFGGVVWMGLFYVAGYIWPDNNPFFDDHIIYALVLVGLLAVGAQRYLGFGRRWERTKLAQRYPILK